MTSCAAASPIQIEHTPESAFSFAPPASSALLEWLEALADGLVRLPAPTTTHRVRAQGRNGPATSKGAGPLPLALPEHAWRDSGQDNALPCGGGVPATPPEERPAVP
jgi:hypothetical protein